MQVIIARGFRFFRNVKEFQASKMLNLEKPKVAVDYLEKMLL